MSPTQAQIEAAAKAIYFCQHSIMHDHERLWVAEDKLRGDVWRDCAKAALTAAAEVRGSLKGSGWLTKAMIDEIAAERAATIEHCAQVADKIGEYHTDLYIKHSLRDYDNIRAVTAQNVAAAIRALKNE